MGRLFGSCNFVLCGNVPDFHGAKWTHDKLAKLIKGHGGRVKKSLPSQVTTKKYILVVNEQQASKKIPLQVGDAVRYDFEVVTYAFLFNSLERGALCSVSNFKCNTGNSIANITRNVTLDEKIFWTEGISDTIY